MCVAIPELEVSLEEHPALPRLVAVDALHQSKVTILILKMSPPGASLSAPASHDDRKILRISTIFDNFDNL